MRWFTQFTTSLLTVTSIRTPSQSTQPSRSRSLGHSTALLLDPIHGHLNLSSTNSRHSVSESVPAPIVPVDGLSVFFVFLPPVATIVVPSLTVAAVAVAPAANDTATFMLIGLDGYMLHMLCERLGVSLRALHTNAALSGLRQLYYGYERFAEIRQIHRRMYTRNYMTGFNSR